MPSSPAGGQRSHPVSGLLSGQKALLWVLVWSTGLLAAWTWFLFFLNRPARVEVQTALFNTLLSAGTVVVCAFILGWGTALLLHFLDRPQRRRWYLALMFLLNLLRSIPQIVGMLLGYTALTALIRGETLRVELFQVLMAAILTSLVVFQEVSDVIRERIRHYMQMDFVNALLVCGVPEFTIINREILRKNSMAHLVQKGVALFGTAIFLVCSIDFIISVGLSNDVSLSNFPPTLGSMLATLDSKQDILVIGTALSDPAVASTLLFEHLQGIGVAFLIVFTLLCVYRISNGLVERYRL
jgi:ABC-type dipeptide/oligopeptide/nickel transport system permease subunit